MDVDNPPFLYQVQQQKLRLENLHHRCASERVHCFENNGFSGLGGWLCFKNPPIGDSIIACSKAFSCRIPFQVLLLQDHHLYFFLHPSLPQSGFLDCKVYRSTVYGYLHAIYLSCRVFPLSDSAVAIAGWFWFVLLLVPSRYAQALLAVLLVLEHQTQYPLPDKLGVEFLSRSL